MDKKITNADELKLQIQLLEIKQAQEGKELKAEFIMLSDSIKPYTVLKKTFMDFKEDMMKNTLGQTAGFLTKEIIIGQSFNPVKRLIGSALQFGVSSLISKNPEKVDKVKSILFNLFKRNKKPVNDHKY